MVENTCKGRGRPRTFDNDAVLDKAIAVFWRKGFDGASLDDLSEAMGIGRPSIYCAFGDKDRLFMQCLNRYVATVCAPPLERLLGSTDLKSAIYEFLSGFAENATRDSEHPGCLLSVVAATVVNPAVKSYVASQFAQAESAIAQRLQTDVVAGALPPNFNSRLAARRVTDAILSIGARAAHGAIREDLERDAHDVADLIFG